MPSARESSDGEPVAHQLNHTRIPATRLATIAVPRAAVIGANRSTGAARSSSSRPLSSSRRVCRPTRNMLIRAAATAPKALACHITWPPSVLSARAGPSMAMNAVFCAMLAAARSNSAWLV